MTAPVGVEATSTASSLVVSVAGIGRTTAAGSGVGELSGSALVVRIQVRNPTDAPVDVSLMTVALFSGEAGLLAAPVTSDSADAPLSGTIEPGKSGSGDYVFLAPEDPAADIAVVVDLVDGTAPIVFTGGQPSL